MKQSRGTGGDMRPVNGSVLGATRPRASGGLDAMSMSLAQLSAFALPQMSNATMAALEDVLRIEPYKKPDLRKFIIKSRRLAARVCLLSPLKCKTTASG